MALHWLSLNVTIMSINEFANVVRYARKRTSIILADETFQATAQALKVAGFGQSDMEDLYDGRMLLTDDQIINKLKSLASDKPVLLLNLELFIGPRFSDEGFVEQLAQKLIVIEPKQPIIMLFYSAKLFRTFSTIYQLNPLTQRHTLDLTDNSASNEV